MKVKRENQSKWSSCSLQAIHSQTFGPRVSELLSNIRPFVMLSTSKGRGELPNQQPQTTQTTGVLTTNTKREKEDSEKKKSERGEENDWAFSFVLPTTIDNEYEG